MYYFPTNSEMILIAPMHGHMAGYSMVAPNRYIQFLMLCQSGGRFFLIEIICITILRHFQVTEGIKINAQMWCQLLVDKLSSWLVKQSNTRRRILLYQHDNSTFHPAKYDAHYLAINFYKTEKLTTQSVNNLEIHPIENFWHSLKRRSMMVISTLQAELT